VELSHRHVAAVVHLAELLAELLVEHPVGPREEPEAAELLAVSNYSREGRMRDLHVLRIPHPPLRYVS